MSLYQSQETSDTPEQRLANEARARITELTDAMFLAYANLQNYLTNNDKGVTEAKVRSALGKDAADFEYLRRAMKRFLVRANPAAKEQLRALIPKKTKTASR